MSITFLIGNGFDKALGKKTGYQDFYNWLKKQPSSSNPFVEEMKIRISDSIEDWSDFEVGLGNFTEVFKDADGTQSASSDAIVWKREVDRLLTSYLKSEDAANDVKSIIDSTQNVQELWDLLFATSLFINMLDNPATSHKRNIYFISLNYTDSLDQIVKKVGQYQPNNSMIKIHSEVFHPHGSLSSQIVLGVNDSFGFKNKELIEKPDNWELKSSMLKQSFIADNIGTSCERRCQGYISRSKVVCIYGASLGQTDEFWWDLLASWLQRDEQHRLVIFWYFPGDGKHKEQVTIEIQNVFLDRLFLTEDEKMYLRQRIIVYFHKRDFLFSSQQKLVVSLGKGITLPLIFVEVGGAMSKKRSDTNEKEDVAAIKKSFYVGETPVTQEQYMAVMGTNPSNNKGKKNPVEQVSWYDAMAFCEILNEKNLAPAGYRFSLPTETQWEYVARGGKKSKGYKYSGSNNIDDVAWYDGNSNKKSHEVKTKMPNELNVYDMSGNVWEWCLDEDSDRRMETSDSVPYRVDRGGAHDCDRNYAQVSFQSSFPPGDTCYSIGFRVVLVLKTN